MRIAMVSEHASPLALLGGVDAGGQNVHVAALAEAVAARGAEVVVHTRRDDPESPRRVAFAPGVEVDHVDAGPAEVLSKDELLVHMEAFAADLVEQWRAWRPDVVHAHFWMSGHAALIAARQLGIPVVQTFHALGTVKRRHQGDRDTSPPERADIERAIIRDARHIVATCSDEVFELIRMGASRAKLTVVPCGADLATFRPDGPVAPRRGDRQRLVSVGRLVERKGVGTAISSLRHLPDAELLIAGGPARADLSRDPEARRLRELARREGVEDRVRLLGRLDREATAALMRSADVQVSVPWYEPFGIVPVEAMACGVPVVASAVGGMIDTVVDGVTGSHVPPRDPERLAEAVAALLADPGARRQMGLAGQARARRLYDWGRIGAATHEVYERVAPETQRRTRRFRRAGDAGGSGAHRGRPLPTAREHVAGLRTALEALEGDLERVEAWGAELAHALRDGGRLLAVGNGGSAAEAQHLTAELVGRYITERQPLSAICLHGDTSAATAICNDYGVEEMFARQVLAHGRPGDVLVALSTSGRSPNVLAAVRAAREAGLTTWGMTGAGPNPLVDLCDDCLAFDAPTTATVQELHLVAIHVLCGAVDRELALPGSQEQPEPVRAEQPARVDRRALRAVTA